MRSHILHITQLTKSLLVTNTAKPQNNKVYHIQTHTSKLGQRKPVPSKNRSSKNRPKKLTKQIFHTTNHVDDCRHSEDSPESNENSQPSRNHEKEYFSTSSLPINERNSAGSRNNEEIGNYKSNSDHFHQNESENSESPNTAISTKQDRQESDTTPNTGESENSKQENTCDSELTNPTADSDSHGSTNTDSDENRTEYDDENDNRYHSIDSEEEESANSCIDYEDAETDSDDDY